MNDISWNMLAFFFLLVLVAFTIKLFFNSTKSFFVSVPLINFNLIMII